MNWKFLLYDWGGWNVALFQAINSGTPGALDPWAWLFSLVGSYWTAPLMLLGLWWWSTSASNPTRACAVRHRLVTFGVAFALALLAASALKWGLDFPRPPAVLGTLVHVIGVAELRYSLPSGTGCGRTLALDGTSRPSRLGVLRRSRRVVTHCGGDAFSGGCTCGLDPRGWLRRCRWPPGAVACCNMEEPWHTERGLVWRCGVLLHGRSSCQVRHHADVCLW